MHSPVTIDAQSSSGFLRVGAISSVALAIALLALFAMGGILSTASARLESRVFLADVENQLTLLGASVWVAATFSFLLGPFFIGLYVALRATSEHLMRASLVAGIVTLVIGVLLVSQQAAGAGHIVPSWHATTDPAVKAPQLMDFQALTWAMDTSSRMFDFSVTVASLLASAVMLRTGARALRILGWLGIASGSIHLPSVILLIFLPAFEPVHFVADLTFLVWVVGSGITLWRVQRRGLSVTG